MNKHSLASSLVPETTTTVSEEWAPRVHILTIGADSKLTDKDMKEIGKSEHLQMLDICGGRGGITSQGIKYLQNQHLHTLEIQHVDCTDDTLQAIAAQLPALEILHIWSGKLLTAAGGVQHLCSLKHMQNLLLRVNAARFGDGTVALTHLSHCKSLEALTLIHISINDLAPLASMAKNMEALKLLQCTLPKDKSPLAKLQAVTQLALNNNGTLVDSDMKHIAQLQKLKDLDLSENARLSAMCVAYLAAGECRTSLQNLHLNKCGIALEKALSFFLFLQNPRRLWMDGPIEPTALAQLCQQRPDLVVEHCNGLVTCKPRVLGK